MPKSKRAIKLDIIKSEHGGVALRAVASDWSEATQYLGHLGFSPQFLPQALDTYIFLLRSNGWSIDPDQEALARCKLGAERAIYLAEKDE